MGIRAPYTFNQSSLLAFAHAQRLSFYSEIQNPPSLDYTLSRIRTIEESDT